MKQILAADIGGTSSRFSRFELSSAGNEQAGLRQCESVWLKTAEASSFAELLESLRKQAFPLPIEAADAAAIAIAGPVEDGVRAYPPNISWTIDLDLLRNELALPKTVLLNDFVAQAWAICSPLGAQCEPVITPPASRVRADDVRVVLGAGTGLGKAIVVPVNGASKYRVLPSEGGHSRLPIQSDEEFDFFTWLREEAGVECVTYDEIVSGRGLARIHEFLTGEQLTPAEISAKEALTSDTLSWFARFYGRVCRDFALETLPFGGLYIAGGIAAKIPGLVQHQEFHREFFDCPSHRQVLERVPVLLNRNEESGIWGAGFRGQVLLG